MPADADIADAGDDQLVSDAFTSNVMSLTCDNNGNLTDDGIFTFVYDGWNRLVEGQLTESGDTTTIATYDFLGNNRRIKKVVQNCGVENTPNDGGNTTVVFYYDRRWRIVETRDGSNQATAQYVWGTRYTDEIIFVDINGDETESNDCNPDEQGGESTADSRYFYHQDRNWNVVALSEYDINETNNGRVVERYSYTPYGGFVVLEGDSGSGELGNLQPTSTIGNPFAHQGLPIDHEKASYQNRYREYAPGLQRFAQRDPVAYVSDMSLYVYTGSNPLGRSDPLGLMDIGDGADVFLWWLIWNTYWSCRSDPECWCTIIYGRHCPQGSHYEFNENGECICAPDSTDEGGAPPGWWEDPRWRRCIEAHLPGDGDAEGLLEAIAECGLGADPLTLQCYIDKGLGIGFDTLLDILACILLGDGAGEITDPCGSDDDCMLCCRFKWYKDILSGSPGAANKLRWCLLGCAGGSIGESESK